VTSSDALVCIGMAEPKDYPLQVGIVADEGKCLELAFDLLQHGSTRRDLVDKLELQTKLAIPSVSCLARLRECVGAYRRHSRAPRYAQLSRRRRAGPRRTAARRASGCRRP
jgi:hypothetical protein